MTFLPGFDPPPVLPTPTAEDDDFYTPLWLLEWLPPIALDPCAAAKSLVQARRKYDLRDGQDGLVLPWTYPLDFTHSIVFTNCPYSDCARWVARCREQSDCHGVNVVALIPAKPGEAYWHEHIWPCATVGFLRGRIRFDTVNGPAEDAATFGSALVVWGPLRAYVAERIALRAEKDKRRPVWCMNAA